MDQDEEHLRHHVQNWLDAAVAVSGQGHPLCMQLSPGPEMQQLLSFFDRLRRAASHANTATYHRMPDDTVMIPRAVLKTDAGHMQMD